jgi:fused signal recognition particle receptor
MAEVEIWLAKTSGIASLSYAELLLAGLAVLVLLAIVALATRRKPSSPEIVTPEASSEQEKAPSPEEATQPASEAEPSADKEPSASKVPSAKEEPSADKEPSAGKEPSAKEEPSHAAVEPATDTTPETVSEPEEKPAPKVSLRERLRQGVARTGSGFTSVFLGKPAIDEDLLEELETLLLMADVGIEATTEIIEALTDSLNRKELADADALRSKLQQLLLEIVQSCQQPLAVENTGKPKVILVVGVNGVGKTTTIGKMARRFQSEGRSVMLAAGDTFRAAAVEQLQTWGERNNVPVVAQHTGADSASVIFDALQSAQSKGVDVLIADTAGRLHNKSNLMEELKKVTRVMAKLDETAPHEVLLVLDAGTGQNALSQMQEFHSAVGVTGVALTKLDGTAKGGVIFPLCKKFGVPVRFIGVGESAEDLQTFDAGDFVEALLAAEDPDKA